MREGNYYYAVEDGICIVKPVGSITVPLCAGIDAFLDRIFEEKPIEEVVIDMTETDYIDSTNLGVLLRINRHYFAQNGKRPAIVTAGGGIDKILYDLNLDKIFNIISQVCNTPDGDFKNLPRKEKKEEELRRIIVRAHYNLMAIDETNRARFADIVRLMDEDPGKNEPF